MELENLVGSFKNYQDGDAYEEVAQIAKDIKQRIDEAMDTAKLINNRQGLAELDDITDYSTVTQMSKDFIQYYNLWTTVEAWNKRHHSWLHDPFDELDPVQVEETVENAKKTMS